MNDDFESLESELANLEPIVPSPQLRDRIAKQLTALAPVERKNSWRLPLVIAAAVSLAASLLVILLPPNSTIDVAPPKEFAAPSTQALDPSSPSVWSYHRALTVSGQSLDGVLDQHTAPTSSSDEPLARAAAFRSFTSANQAAFGEL